MNNFDYDKKFNWGAFLLGWIWGLFNKTYVTLWQIPISFIPYIGFVLNFILSIYFGIKGNEWAFNNKAFKDYDTFKKYQKRLTVVGVIFSLFSVTFFVLMKILFISFELHPVGYNFEESKYRMYMNLILLFMYYILVTLIVYAYSKKENLQKLCFILLLLFEMFGLGFVMYNAQKINPIFVTAQAEEVRLLKDNKVDWRNYIFEMHRKIRSGYNSAIISQNKGTVSLTFSVNKQGQVSNIKIIKPSGNVDFDIYVVNVIKQASPFSVLPEQYTKDNIVFTCTVRNSFTGISILE